MIFVNHLANLLLHSLVFSLFDILEDRKKKLILFPFMGDKILPPAGVDNSLAAGFSHAGDSNECFSYTVRAHTADYLRRCKRSDTMVA